MLVEQSLVLRRRVVLGTLSFSFRQTLQVVMVVVGQSRHRAHGLIESVEPHELFELDLVPRVKLIGERGALGLCLRDFLLYCCCCGLVILVH